MSSTDRGGTGEHRWRAGQQSLSMAAPFQGAAAPFPGSEAAMQRLDHAVNSLRRARPEMSACAPVTPAQQKAFVALLAGVIIVFMAAPHAGQIAALMAITLPFSCVALLRLAALWHFIRVRWRPECDDQRDNAALAAENETWPSYTLLVPLRDEANVVTKLVAALANLDYPRERLEVLFITEQDDLETRRALSASMHEDFMRIVTVPEGTPRTKPRALNYGLTFATGELIAIFDAEDVPEPGQLKAAVAVFRRAGADLACVQARLNIYNPGRNFFTRQFTLEYSALFDAILPALEWLRLPLPLGGTSNHFRRSSLESAGAWDPYNVTEDADLGIRLARQKRLTKMLPSVTWEEAPAAFPSWFAQRTRWIKGWMQTYLVHMRAPRRLMLELGVWRFAGFQVIFAGLILSSLAHPLFFLSAGVQYANGTLFALPGGDVERAVWGLSGINLAICYLSAMSVAGLAVANRGGLTLVRCVFGLPLYWMAISAAAYRALFELVIRPHFWAKTAHTGDGREDLELIAR